MGYYTVENFKNKVNIWHHKNFYIVLHENKPLRFNGEMFFKSMEEIVKLLFKNSDYLNIISEDPYWASWLLEGNLENDLMTDKLEYAHENLTLSELISEYPEILI